VESTLRSLPGVFDVKAWLTDKNVGEAKVVYNPAEVKLGDLKQAVPLAGGERHNFTVISVKEES
jgi:copper chaperone CopZ